MDKNKIKQKLSEELSKSDKDEIGKIVKTEMDDYFSSKEFDRTLEKKIKDNLSIKNNSKIEKEVTEISKKVITQLYKTLWVRRSFWQNSIK